MQANAARRAGALAGAVAYYREAMRGSRVHGLGMPAEMTLVRQAGLAAAAGRAVDAARLFAASAASRARSGLLAGAERLDYPPTHDGDLGAVRARLGEPPVAAAWAEGEAMTLEQAVACAQRDAID